METAVCIFLICKPAGICIIEVCNQFKLILNSFHISVIARYNVLQESLIKLVEACSDQSHSMDRWLSKLEASSWQAHVKEILTTACLAAQCIDRSGKWFFIQLFSCTSKHKLEKEGTWLQTVGMCVHLREGASVLVHGTEGTDSTLQVTSLAQIILDPGCRTIKGFQSLVEREWLQVSFSALLRAKCCATILMRVLIAHSPCWLFTQAGHPFQQRCAQSAFSNSKPRQEAPVFLLFLDCVWQILRQFPCSFEFNECFLVLLFEHAYASQFGTFLGNSAAERWDWSSLMLHVQLMSVLYLFWFGFVCVFNYTHKMWSIFHISVFFHRAKLCLPEKTVSLWSWVNRPQELERLTNPLYEPNSLVIWPSVAPQSLLLWEGKKQIFKQCYRSCWTVYVPQSTKNQSPDQNASWMPPRWGVLGWSYWERPKLYTLEYLQLSASLVEVLEGGVSTEDC